MSPRETVVRHAYEQTANRLARLSIFAETGEVGGYTYEVTFRQAQLATDDVLNIAIACRRLIDTLLLREISLSRRILAVAPGMQWPADIPPPTEHSLHDTLNRIIHSSYIEVISFTYQLTRQSTFAETWKAVSHREEFRIPTLLCVRSDRGPLSFCHLSDFCQAIDEILDASQEVAAEHRIFLGEF
jgi:hypothetical protein